MFRSVACRLIKLIGAEWIMASYRLSVRGRTELHPTGAPEGAGGGSPGGTQGLGKLSAPNAGRLSALRGTHPVEATVLPLKLFA